MHRVGDRLIPTCERAAKPSSASDGSSTGPSRIARRKPAIGSSPSPACHRPNGAAYALRMQPNGYTRSSSAGSRRRPCCSRQTRPPYCSGRCSPPARSTCERSMVGKPLPQIPSISKLTSQLDPLPSICRRQRRANSNHISDGTYPTEVGSQVCLMTGRDKANRDLIEQAGLS
jgi:hypothetical protein